MKSIVRSFTRFIMFVGTVAAAFFFVRNLRSRRSQEEESLLPAVPVKRDLTISEPETIEKTISAPQLVVKKESKKIVPEKDKIDLNPRQEVIFAMIRGRKTIDMKDLLPRIPGVTERTLRRDLLKLQEAGLISKKGTTKASTYVLN